MDISFLTTQEKHEFMGSKKYKTEKQTSTTSRSILIHQTEKKKEERTPKPKIDDDQPVWDVASQHRCQP
jgi:hypothetical protein